MSSLLDITGLHLVLSGHAVLRDVSLQVAEGEWVGLIGPNGSGKSSLLRACIGRVEYQGRIRVGGFDPDRHPELARAQMGYAVDQKHLPDALRGRQCIELVGDLRGCGSDAVDQAERVAHALGLGPWLEMEVGSYSLGTRQKLSIVLALIGDPPLLLLDEVFNGLDPVAAWQLKLLLRERVRTGTGVLLTTHDLGVAERLLDRVVLLVDGHVVATWSRDELDVLRAEAGGLEAAMVSRLRDR